MNFLKKHKTTIIISIITVLILAGSFLCDPAGWRDKHVNTDPVIFENSGSDNDTSKGYEEGLEFLGEETLEKELADDETFFDTEAKDVNDNERPEKKIQSDNINVTGETEPEDVEETVESKDELTHCKEPESETKTAGKLVCTLSVRCDINSFDIAHIDENKKKLIPADGKIFSCENVEFFENESVFNVLLREMKKNKIHMDFVNTPIYNSVYVRGIANIYEKDFGDLSGWIYKVNGENPSVGCSGYKLSSGDIIEWTYTLMP